jgi:hypothetical protein
MQLAFVVIVLLCTWTSTDAQTDISNAVGNVQAGYTVPSDTLQRYLVYTPSTVHSVLNFTLFPCYGSLNWYLDINRAVIPDNSNACALKWNPNVRKTWCAPATYNGTTYNILVEGIRTYTGAPVFAAKFDIAIFLSEFDFSDQVPSPGGGGVIDGSLLENLKKGDRQEVTLKWTGTGNSNDAYTLYMYNNGENPVTEDSGYIPTSGCGIKEFMQPVTGIDISVSGNDYTAKVGDLDPETEYWFAVVVQRSAGYLNSYKVLTVNDSAVKTYSFLVMAFCVLVSLFGTFM